MKPFGEILSEKRKEKGYTQVEFAKMCFLSAPAICFYENGRSYPDIMTACKMADILGCTLDELVGRT